MDKVTSRDGTPIAFDRLGDGPAVVMVGGGSVDRMANAPLATELSTHFTVFNYDRRGRGDSGDTAPYAVQREVEDIAAVIAAAGGSAFLYGTSSGAALAGPAATPITAAATTAAVLFIALLLCDPVPPASSRPGTDPVRSHRRSHQRTPRRPAQTHPLPRPRWRGVRPEPADPSSSGPRRGRHRPSSRRSRKGCAPS